jgi:hypothetical protein
MLERKLGWRGLIYEMSPLNKALVLAKNRKATFAPVCVSMNPWPERVSSETIIRNRVVILPKT